MQRLEAALGVLDERVRDHEGLLGSARERIRAEETTLGHEATLSADLEAELDRTRARLAELNSRVAMPQQGLVDAHDGIDIGNVVDDGIVIVGVLAKEITQSQTCKACLGQ